MGRYDFLIYLLHVEKFLKAHTVTCTEADTVSGDKWENDVSEGQMVVDFSEGLWSRLLESSDWVWLCGEIRDFPGMDMETGVRKGRQSDKTGEHSMAKGWQTVQGNNPARTECWHKVLLMAWFTRTLPRQTDWCHWDVLWHWQPSICYCSFVNSFIKKQFITQFS